MSNHVARGQSFAFTQRHFYGECAHKRGLTNHFPASVENKAVHYFTFIQQTGVFSTIKTDRAIFVCLI